MSDPHFLQGYDDFGNDGLVILMTAKVLSKLGSRHFSKCIVCISALALWGRYYYNPSWGKGKLNKKPKVITNKWKKIGFKPKSPFPAFGILITQDYCFLGEEGLLQLQRVRTCLKALLHLRWSQIVQNLTREGCLQNLHWGILTSKAF